GSKHDCGVSAYCRLADPGPRGHGAANEKTILLSWGGAMERRFRGKSGVQVSALSFGAMTFGGEGMMAMVGNTQEAEADRLVGICIEGGINFFDTADAYSNGRSEEILGHALRDKRHDVVLA